MMVITYRFDHKKTAELQAVVVRATAAVEDLTPVWEGWLPKLIGRLAQNFADSGNSEGSWTPLKPATIEAKRRKGLMLAPLLATGSMRNAVTQKGAPGNICEIEPRRLRWGCDMTLAGHDFNYALVHDLGGKKVPVPKREFLILDTDVIREIERELAREIKRAFQVRETMLSDSLWLGIS